MNIFNEHGRIVITCNKRLAPYLEQEVVELGYTPESTFQTGLVLQGTGADCIRLNLNLRCASQVLYSLFEFNVKNPDQLYRAVSDFHWEKVLPGDGYFSVTSNVSHPTINTALFANVKVKDAIVDRFRLQTGKRPDSGSARDRAVVHLFWKDDRGEIFIDTSGETLAKHGYRKIPGKAPMLEALAAATLLATKWDRVSPFINPMCGSSTLAIEAALLATNRRPGLYRENYAFMHVNNYEESVYKRELRQLREQVKEVPGLVIVATDIREDAVDISKVNAEAAGVGKLIQFAQGDFAKTAVPAGRNGVVYFNPEYGERLGDLGALQDTYARIGDFMKQQCRGYTGYIFTGNLELAKKIGLRAARRIEFYNAKIDCRLLEYELYAGSKPEDRKGNENNGA